MDIIQELTNFKSELAGMASTTIMLPTDPPQHPFAAGVSVENVIRKIDILIDKIERDNEKIHSSSALSAMYSYIQSYVEAGGPHTKSFISGLYDYLEILSNQILDLYEQVGAKAESSFYPSKIQETFKKLSTLFSEKIGSCN